MQKRQAEMTPKEAAEYAAKQKEESRRKQHDMFLISTYPSVKEIENVRDVRLDQINGQITAAEAYITSLTTRVEGLKTRALILRALQHQAGRTPHARRSRRGNGPRHERAAHAEFGAGHKKTEHQNVVATVRRRHQAVQGTAHVAPPRASTRRNTPKQ